MRIFISIILSTVLFATPCLAGEVVKFVFDLQPGAILISSKADGFQASRSSFFSFQTETIDGAVSFIPNARIGLGVDAGVVNLDFTGGVGYLWNNAFSAPLARGDVAARFKLGEAITLGPHAGLVFFGEPKWSGDAQLEFSSTTGFMGGLDFTAGKKVSFLASIDYANAKFDVTPQAGWVVNSRTLDMSGVAIQLGIVGRF